MKMIGLCLVILSFSQLANGSEQAFVGSKTESLSAELVPFTFNLYSELSDPQHIQRIEVVNSINLQPIQTIENFKAKAALSSLALIDVNFDGVKDIRVESAQSDLAYYWLYNKQSGRFERNFFLEKIPFAQFDSKNKKIISIQPEPTGTRTAYYEYQNQIPVLVRQEIQYCDQNQQCETTTLVQAAQELKKTTQRNPQATSKVIKPLSYAKQDLNYLYGITNKKALCLNKVNEAIKSEDHAKIMKAQVQLSECYKNIILDLSEKFYPADHFGKDLEGEINKMVEQHHRLLNKMAHCPNSKQSGCRHFESFDVIAGTVDYLNELIEFMVLNVGEGYTEFNPERWFKRWDSVLAKS